MRPEAPIFFVDRCLGSVVVPEALRQLGARVEIHGDHFSPNAPDTEILRLAGANGWVFLSKDKRIRHRQAEIAALLSANVAAFIATAGGATGEAIAAAFGLALQRMERLCTTHTRPFIATVTLAGQVRLLQGERRGGVRR